MEMTNCCCKVKLRLANATMIRVSNPFRLVKVLTVLFDSNVFSKTGKNKANDTKAIVRHTKLFYTKTFSVTRNEVVKSISSEKGNVTLSHTEVASLNNR